MKVVVSIDLPDNTPEDLKRNAADWFPTGDESVISIDGAHLVVDPEDDSFYLFRLVEVRP